MPADRVTVRLGPETIKRIEELAVARQLTTSELVRQALERYLEQEDDRSESAYEAARRAGIIGVVDDLPGDLSTNAEHFEGFGQA